MLMSHPSSLARGAPAVGGVPSNFEAFYAKNRAFFARVARMLPGNQLHCGGVGMMLLHTYNKPGDPKHGKTCMIGCKNMSGAYDMCNGKTSDVSERDICRLIARTLYSEMEEEFCLRFKPDADLDTIVVDIITTGSRCSNILFVASVNGIRTKPITDELIRRQANPSLPHAWREMLECAHVLIGQHPGGGLAPALPVTDYAATWIYRAYHSYNDLRQSQAFPLGDQIFELART